MNNPIRNPYNKIPLFQSPLNDLLRYAYININKCKAAVQSNLQPYQIKTISADIFQEPSMVGGLKLWGNVSDFIKRDFLSAFVVRIFPDGPAGSSSDTIRCA
jgi:hypothetical protein